MSVDVTSITLTDHNYKFVMTNGVKRSGTFVSKDDKWVRLYNDVMKQEETLLISEIASFTDDGVVPTQSDYSNPTIPYSGPKYRG
jgi:hypothetical protein